MCWGAQPIGGVQCQMIHNSVKNARIDLKPDGFDRHDCVDSIFFLVWLNWSKITGDLLKGSNVTLDAKLVFHVLRNVLGGQVIFM